jgi:hypothetical protein
MPNWAETDVAAVMPTRKVEEFKSYFLSHNPEENKDRKKYFGRTFLNDVNEEKNAKGMSLVRSTATVRGARIPAWSRATRATARKSSS